MEAKELALCAWERGWRPVRLRPGDKRPADTGWNAPEAAWESEEAIASAFSGSNWNVGLWHPEAVVLDVDDPSAWHGLLEDLEASHPGVAGELAHAPFVWTRRGFHAFLRAPNGLAGTTLRPGVEIKTGASGQQVAGPCSVIVHDDGTTEERDGIIPDIRELPAAPAALREATRAAKERHDYDAGDYEDTEAGIEGFRRLLAEDAKHGRVNEGEATASAFSGEGITGRDNLLFAAASASHDFGLTRETAYDLIVNEGWLDARIGHGEHPIDKDDVAFKLDRRHLGKENDPGWRIEAQNAHESPADAFGDVPAEAPAARRKISLVLDGDTLDPPEMLVENMLPRYGVTQLYGEPGSYKSFMAVDLGRHVASGKPWHGWAVTQQAVLYCAGEGKAGAKQRADAWLDYHDEDHAPFAITNEMPPMDAGELLDWAQAVETEWTEPGLVIIDTQHIAMLGMDENSSHDAGQFLRAMRALMERWDATVVLVHHPDKEGRAARGSTAIRGNLDAAYHVYRDEGTKLEVKLAQTKVKDAPEWERKAISFRMVPKGETLVVAPPEPMPEDSNALTREEQDRQEADDELHRERRLAACAAEVLRTYTDERGNYLVASSDEMAKWTWEEHKGDLDMSWSKVRDIIKRPHDRMRAPELAALVHKTGANENRKDRRRMALEWRYNPEASATVADAFGDVSFGENELPI